MKGLCILLLAAAAAPAWAYEPETYLEKAVQAEVLVVAEVVEVHPAAALQFVRYRTVQVFLGEIPGDVFEVGHQPSPSKDLLQPGSRLILILDPDETRGPKSPWAEGVPTLYCMDARDGAVAATPERVEEIRDTIPWYLFASGPPYAMRVKRAQIVLIGEVLEVGSAPGIWMGTIIPTVQSVQYKVIEVLAGALEAEKIEVGYFVVGDTRQSARDKPGISPTLFKPGNRLILLIDPGKCVKEMTGPGPESGLPVYCSADVQFGAVPADAEYLAKVRNALRPRE